MTTTADFLKSQRDIVEQHEKNGEQRKLFAMNWNMCIYSHSFYMNKNAKKKYYKKRNVIKFRVVAVKRFSADIISIWEISCISHLFMFDSQKSITIPSSLPHTTWFSWFCWVNRNPKCRYQKLSSEYVVDDLLEFRIHLKDSFAIPTVDIRTFSIYIKYVFEN